MKKYQLFIIIIIASLPIFTFGQRSIFFELEENQKVLQRNFQIIYNSAGKLPLTSKPDLDISNITLSPKYLSWVFLNSKSNYLKLFKPNNICRFTELAYNGLINPTDRIIFEVSLTNSNDDQEPVKNVYGFFNFDQLLTFLKKKKSCPSLEAKIESFNDENLKITLDSYELKKPKELRDCENIISKILDDPMITFFCGKAEEITDGDLAIVELDTNGVNLNSVEKNRLNKKIQRGIYLRNKLGDLNASLMGQICKNLDSPDNFCRPHLREDLWTKTLNGEFPIEKVQSICSSLTNTKIKNKNDLKRCANIANEMPSSCVEVLRQKKSSLFPVTNCNELSRILLFSNLKTDFPDCPSEIENHLFINAQRIASNLKGIHQKYKNRSCKELPNKVYSNISYEYDSESWPLNICYYDPADADEQKICSGIGLQQTCKSFDSDAPLNASNSEKSVLERILREEYNDGIEVNCLFFEKRELDKNLFGATQNCLVYHDSTRCNFLNCPKEVLLNKQKIKSISFGKRELRCLPYIPGDDNENKISETRVISQIVKRVYAASSKLTCKLIPEERYNPIFLDYKQGCFVLSPKNCLHSRCKKKIIYNQKEFKNFEYKGELNENYFELSSQNKVHSMTKKLKKVLDIKDEKILSLTKMKLWFKNNNKLIHGLGCIEDLYPDFFRRTVFNQCKVIPFIISGTSQENNTEYVIINTTLDLSAYPRKLRWNNLYNSLKMYQHIHPQKLWALYGVK